MLPAWCVCLTLGSFVMLATRDSCTLLATSSRNSMPATVTFQPVVCGGVTSDANTTCNHAQATCHNMSTHLHCSMLPGNNTPCVTDAALLSSNITAPVCVTASSNQYTGDRQPPRTWKATRGSCAAAAAVLPPALLLLGGGLGASSCSASGSSIINTSYLLPNNSFTLAHTEVNTSSRSARRLPRINTPDCIQ